MLKQKHPLNDLRISSVRREGKQSAGCRLTYDPTLDKQQARKFCRGIAWTAAWGLAVRRTDGKCQIAQDWLPWHNLLICLPGIPLPGSIPPSACIPVPAPWSDLIVARVYACVIGQGGGIDGQATETE